MSATARGGDGWGKYILPAAAVGIVAYLLWPKTASAALPPGPPGPPGPGPSPGPSPSPGPRPSPFPPGSDLGIVAVTTGQNGMNVRNAPTPSATLVTAIPNGTVFQILQGDVPEQGLPDTPNAYRWMQIKTAGGQTGYLRSIDGQGISNVRRTTAAVAANTPIEMGAGPLVATGAYVHPYAHTHGWRTW